MAWVRERAAKSDRVVRLGSSCGRALVWAHLISASAAGAAAETLQQPPVPDEQAAAWHLPCGDEGNWRTEPGIPS